jgi:hypothetical protein
LSALLVAHGWTAEGELDGHLVWSKKGRYEAFPLPRPDTDEVSPLHVGYVGTAMGLKVGDFNKAVRQLEKEVPAVASGELAKVVPAHADSGSERRLSPLQAWRRNRKLRRELPKRVFGGKAGG